MILMCSDFVYNKIGMLFKIGILFYFKILMFAILQIIRYDLVGCKILSIVYNFAAL